MKCITPCDTRIVTRLLNLLNGLQFGTEDQLQHVTVVCSERADTSWHNFFEFSPSARLVDPNDQLVLKSMQFTPTVATSAGANCHAGLYRSRSMLHTVVCITTSSSRGCTWRRMRTELSQSTSHGASMSISSATLSTCPWNAHP